MSNPFTGVLINGMYYNYTPGSYKGSVPLRNDSNETQNNNRAFTILGKGLPVHTIDIKLENTYTPYDPTNNNQLGSTSWKGVSRLADLLNTLGGLGSSQPITFVPPDGSTHLVVPIGSIDYDVFISDAPQAAGIEWNVHLTLTGASVI